MASSSQSNLAAAAGFHLPIDVTIEILSRLPVTSLLRFKSVCKNWYDLITSPNFIAKHLNESTLNSTSLLVSGGLNHEASSYRMSLHLNDAFDWPINLDFPFLTGSESLTIVGVCNGLVCVSLSLYGFPLIVCNPATRQFREIPHHRWWDDEDGVTTKPNVKWVTFGFGFHHSSNDYKLIRIVYYYNDSFRPSEESIAARADLYTMSTDSWREIDDKVPLLYSSEVDAVVPCQIFLCSASAYLNGTFYWGACGFPINEVFVVSFDLGNEVFQEIRTPPCFDDIRNNDALWRLTESMDKLAVITYPDNGDDRSFDLWVLDENGRSWTKQFEAGPFPSTAGLVGCGKNDKIRLVGCAKNGEIVVKDVKKSGKLNLFSYHPTNQETKNLLFAQFGSSDQICLYSQTLLPVMGMKSRTTLKPWVTRGKRKKGSRA